MSLLWLGSVAAVLFGGLVAVAIHAARPWLIAWLKQLPAPMRARLALALLSAPATVGIALSVLAVLPGVAASVSPAFDHCPAHGDHHLHLCLVHRPQTLAWGRLVSVLGLAGLAIGLRVAVSLARVIRGQRVVSALRRAARPSGRGYDVVAADVPLAVTAGVLRPRVYLTRGLLERVCRTTRAIVLAHEAAHQHRRDPATKLIGELLGALHWPHTRRALLEELSLACEQACDEAAAATVGDRTAVADALVKLERLIASDPPTPCVAVARADGSELASRVQALLAAPTAAPRLPSRWLALAIGFALAGVLITPIHHGTETLLGALFV
ncbi:MAG: M56 family metallopeptidase [Myxococcales bacterium FL481]|nr:MAG: M56 family metallopeptidase [Myxococcales bacterium FL481]